MLQKQNITVGEIQTSVSIREGEGVPLLIVPGNSMSGCCFQELNENPCLKDRKLIYYDFPGHGESSRPSNPELGYGILAYTDHLQSLTAKLKLKEWGLLGISLGGHVALRTARHPSVRELYMVGVPPIANVTDIPEAFIFDSGRPSLFNETISPAEAQEIAEELSGNSETRSLIYESILKTDPAARRWMVENFSRTKLEDEVSILKELSIPWTLYYGENDSLVNFEYLRALPADIRSQMEYLPGEKHIPLWSRFELC